MIPITTFALVPALIIAISFSLAQHYKASHYSTTHMHAFTHTNKTELGLSSSFVSNCHAMWNGKQLCYTFADLVSALLSFFWLNAMQVYSPTVNRLYLVLSN